MEYRNQVLIDERMIRGLILVEDEMGNEMRT